MRLRPALPLLALLAASPAPALTRMGSLSEPADSRGIALSGSHVYWTGFSGLHVADVSDPRAPRDVGALVTPGFGLDVEVVGEVAFVADGDSLQILDVSDPTSPTPLAALAAPAGAEVADVEVVGTRAYLALGSFGLQIVDVSDPSAPHALGAVDSPGIARQVDVRGSTAYLADLLGGLRIIDVSDPAAPFELGHVPGEDVEAVRVVGEIAYLDDVGELRIVDVSEPGAPRPLGALPLPDRANVSDIEVRGALAFLAANQIGLLVADVSDPAAPRQRGRLLTRAWALGVELAGARAYVADLVGVSVIDVSEADFPSELGGLLPGDPFDFAEGVAVSNGIALVGQTAFVRVVDVSDPSAPRELARIEGLGSDPIPEALAGGLAYVRGEGGLHVFDLSDPSQPVPLGQHPKSATAVAVKDGLAYAVGPEDDALDVIDVSDPTAPTTLGTLGGLLFPFDVTVAGGIAYVGDDSWLRLVDVSDPRAPAEIGSLRLPGDAWQVAVLGPYAYVVSQLGSFPEAGRLSVIDVSDPTAPREFVAVPLHATPHAVEVLPGRVFVGADDGIRVFSLDEDEVLTDLGAFATGEVAWDLELTGGLVYAAFDGRGLRIVDFGPEYGQRVEIHVDARPGHGPHANGRGRVAVTVLGSELLDAAAIDPASLRFGPGEARPQAPSQLRDADRDGFLDLVSHFRTGDAELSAGAGTACLHGRLEDGARFLGCDAPESPPPRGRAR